MDMLYVDKNLLDIKVVLGGFSFFVTCVYGDLVMKGRAKVWEKLTRIGILRTNSWCVMGDFNDIQHNDEKLGEPSKSDETFVPFNDMLRY